MLLDDENGGPSSFQTRAHVPVSKFCRTKTVEQVKPSDASRPLPDLDKLVGVCLFVVTWRVHLKPFASDAPLFHSWHLILPAQNWADPPHEAADTKEFSRGRCRHSKRTAICIHLATVGCHLKNSAIRIQPRFIPRSESLPTNPRHRHTVYAPQPNERTQFH